MGFPIGKVLDVALRVFDIIQAAVPIVEALTKGRGRGKGEEKRAAVLELVQAELAAAELVLGRPLAHDREVLEAAGGVSDAMVTFHKVLARKVADAGGS